MDLTTAPAVAAAAEALLDALGPPLRPLLVLALEAGAEASLGEKASLGGCLLPCLLQLYALAVALHARCAALHPQVRHGLCVRMYVWPAACLVLLRVFAVTVSVSAWATGFFWAYACCGR